MSCKGCEAAAKKPDTVEFGPDCEQCCARAIACTTVIRQALAEGEQLPQFRRAIAHFFPGREQHGRELVKAWWRKLRDHSKPSKEIAR